MLLHALFMTCNHDVNIGARLVYELKSESRSWMCIRDGKWT